MFKKKPSKTEQVRSIAKKVAVGSSLTAAVSALFIKLRTRGDK